MDGGILVPLGFFAFLAAIILVPGYYKQKNRERLHETLRIAYERGQPVPPELIDSLQTDQQVEFRSTPERDLRRAVVLIGVALGLCAMGAILYNIAGYETMFSLMAGGAIPGFIGLGYLFLYLSRRNRTEV